MNEYTDPLDRPQRYKLTTPQLCASIGRNQSWVSTRCDRLHDPLPHIIVRRGMLKTRYYDPKEVAEWMARQTAAPHH